MNFSWFCGRKSLLKTGLLVGMTDIHSHLLPGVDDGIATKEEALHALDYLAHIGVSRIYLTPHLMNDLKANTPEFLQAVFSDLEKVVPEKIALRLAGEYMLDAGFERQRRIGLLTFPGKYILLETSCFSSIFGFKERLYELTLDGFRPILAHPERYIYMGMGDYEELKEKGCAFQLNLMSLGGIYGKEPKQRAFMLLEKGYYEYVGSDIHALPVYAEMIEKCRMNDSGLKQLEKLFQNNTTLW